MNTNKQGAALAGVKKFYGRFNYLISFLILVIIASVISTVNGSQFLTYTNLSTLVKQSAIVGIIALGMNLIIISGQIDLSVGSSIALVSGFSVMVLNQTQNIFLTFAFAVTAGAVCGTINGILVTKGKIAPFVATLATMTAFRSIIVQVGQGGPFNVSKEMFDGFRQIAAGSLFTIGGYGVPNLAVMFVIMTILMSVVMNRTKFGRYVYAVGSNENAARLTGINVGFIKCMTFTITGALIGFSAVLLASRLSGVTAVQVGLGFELDAIAAVAIGGTLMSGGRGKIPGTFFGMVMLQMIQNILVMAKVPVFLEGLVKGCIIVLVVIFQSKKKN